MSEQAARQYIRDYDRAHPSMRTDRVQDRVIAALKGKVGYAVAARLAAEELYD